ncbi:MAG: DUF4384 domain-containing protein [Acidobacteriota bacterium]
MKLRDFSRILSTVLLACLAAIAPAQDREGNEVTRQFIQTRSASGTPPFAAKRHPKPAARIGLGYTLYKKNANDEPVRVTAAQNFGSGDNLRFVIESNITGYLYIFHQENNGPAKMLYPDARLEWGKNRIKAHVPHEVPSSNDGRWFNFSGPDATERFYLVVSRETLPKVLTGDKLLAYSRKNPGDYAWHPPETTWKQLLAQAKAPVRESQGNLLGQVQTQAERDAIRRNVDVKLDDPAPTIIRMSESPKAKMLVTMIELAHIQPPTP